jgi:hypothetical protein
MAETGIIHSVENNVNNQTKTGRTIDIQIVRPVFFGFILCAASSYSF